MKAALGAVYWVLSAVICGAMIFVALAFLAPLQGFDPLSLAMPVNPNTPVGGVYSEVEDRTFRFVNKANYQFEPSQSTRDLAVQHTEMEGGTPRIWYDYVPTPDRKKMPLIILLHGANRDGLSMIEMWQQTAAKYQIALVAPNSAGKTWDFDNPDPQFLAGLVAEMAGKYDIDADDIFLFGHSDGATYAELLLNRATGPWRAAVLHAGFAPADWLRPPQVAKPVRLYLGDRDANNPLSAAREVAQALALMGHQSEIVVIPGHDHWIYDIGPQIAEDSWQWLARLPKPH